MVPIPRILTPDWPSLAITSLDPASNTRDLLASVVAPLLVCLVCSLTILGLHCRRCLCRCCSSHDKE